MSILQDITAIAKKALGESNNVTKSDVVPILSDALDAIVELCQMEQDDVAAKLNLERINAFADNLAASPMVSEQIALRVYDFAFALLYEPPLPDGVRLDNTTVIISPNRALVMEESAKLAKQAMGRVVQARFVADLRWRGFPVQEESEQKGQQ